MAIDPTQLLADNVALRRLVADQAALLQAREAALATALEGIKAKTLEIEKLKLQLARLKCRQFGRSSEKLGRTIAQLELALEDLEAVAGEQGAAAPEDGEADPPAETDRRQPKRTAPPAHLPREEQIHEPVAGTCTCRSAAACCAAWVRIAPSSSSTCRATSR